MADPETTIPLRPADAPDEGASNLVVQTYEKDLARAMDTTDASVVQELLQTAREKEVLVKEKEVVRHQRGWYTTGGLILILLALGALGYGIYYYNHLTVPVAPSIAVGVFQSTEPIVVTPETTITDIVTTITAKSDLPEGKPFLVPLISDSTTRAPLSNEELLTTIGARASEPFIAALSLVRLGSMNTGNAVVPFVIFSVPNPEIATKEFLIAEPKLLEMVAPILNIDLATQTDEIGKGFTSSYMYNLPVRSLTALNRDTQQERLVFYYGYATDTTIVLATNPSVLKAVYDTIIRQH